MQTEENPCADHLCLDFFFHIMVSCCNLSRRETTSDIGYADLFFLGGGLSGGAAKFNSRTHRRALDLRNLARMIYANRLIWSKLHLLKRD